METFLDGFACAGVSPRFEEYVRSIHQPAVHCSATTNDVISLRYQAPANLQDGKHCRLPAW
jgi:hypothetical protein